ncbi:MAG: ribonuclease E inhibitor RraB [Actinomycetota bacterium]|nr:ribonuclease E inhibitor RraB [Actinomycetota bacterium]
MLPIDEVCRAIEHPYCRIARPAVDARSGPNSRPECPEWRSLLSSEALQNVLEVHRVTPWHMPFLRRKRHEAVDPNERSPQLGLKYKDLAVLDQLIRNGAHLDQPRHVVHYLYFPTQAAAEVASQHGHEAGLRHPLAEFPGQWSLVCEKREVVTDPITVRDAGNFFDTLAAAHGGEYDGWEASL